MGQQPVLTSRPGPWDPGAPAGPAVSLRPGKSEARSPAGEAARPACLATQRHPGWVKIGQPGEREGEERELANIWASLSDRVRSRCGHMVRDTGKEEPAWAGRLSSSVRRPVTHSLTHSNMPSLSTLLGRSLGPAVQGQPGDVLPARRPSTRPINQGRKALL